MQLRFLCSCYKVRRVLVHLAYIYCLSYLLAVPVVVGRNQLFADLAYFDKYLAIG